MRGTLSEILNHLEEWFGNEPAILHTSRSWGDRRLAFPDNLHLYAAGGQTVEVRVVQDPATEMLHLEATGRRDGSCLARRTVEPMRYAGAGVYHVPGLISFKVRALELLGNLNRAVADAERTRGEASVARALAAPAGKDGNCGAFGRAVLDGIREHRRGR